MLRHRPFAIVVAVCAVLATAFALGRRATAEGSSTHRIVHLHVTNAGPNGKAWFDGGPPTGLPVQAALDRFAAEGFKFSAIVSSGVGPNVQVGTSPPSSRTDSIGAEYLIVLEKP